MSKIIFILGIFFFPFSLWSFENPGFEADEEAQRTVSWRRSPLPLQEESMQDAQKKLSALLKQPLINEEELMEKTRALMHNHPSTPRDFIEKVIDVLHWKNARSVLPFRWEEEWMLYEAVESFFEQRCHLRYWFDAQNWLNQPYGFFRQAAYEGSLEFKEDIISLFEKALCPRAHFRRLVTPIRRIKHLLVRAYKGPIQKISLKALQNAFFYPARINSSIRLIRLFPAVVKLLETSASEQAFDTYFRLFISNITAAYQPHRKQECNQNAFRYLIFGLQGYDSELDEVLKTFQDFPALPIPEAPQVEAFPGPSHGPDITRPFFLEPL